MNDQYHHELQSLEDALIASDDPDDRNLSVIVRYPKPHQVKLAKEYEEKRKARIFDLQEAEAMQ